MRNVVPEPVAVMGQQIQTEQHGADAEESEGVDGGRTVRLAVGVQAPDEQGRGQQAGDSVEDADAGEQVDRDGPGKVTLRGHGVS
ncbi:hypothetical protein [Streptomyces chromofuscus]|uniref:hypothetical protein n=1 Tax=Streptomyces chromofuscus TaxID=42881 RepID=UPI001E37F339|nr:hypothetical protein [Streptomyces chromofuscus]